MYASYFGLRQEPFSIAPDPHYLFMSEQHREALAHLLYGLQGSGGIVLLTGDIGTGKTTVFRHFLEQVPATVQVAYIFNPKLTVLELLRTICDEFGVVVRAATPGTAATVKDHIDPLNAFLLDLHASGRQAVLVIDEAQSLAADVLEQLRLLTNLETSDRKLLQIVLIGQPELRSLLARPELEQISQRVVARYHLGPLTAQETVHYVRHRFKVAGWAGPMPMTDDVLRLVHRLARGIPRRINLLCDRAMLGAYGLQRKTVTRTMVGQAATEVFGQSNALARHSPSLAAIGALAVLTGGVIAGAWWWPFRADQEMATELGTPDVANVRSSPSPPEAKARVTVAPAEPPSKPAGLADFRAATLWSDEASAWRALAQRWGVLLSSAGDPCAHAQVTGLQCFRTGRMSAGGLVQLNRPAILTVYPFRQEPKRVLLIQRAQDGHYILAHEENQWQLNEQELASIWRGDYATLWRTPPGTTIRITDARTPEQRRWIEARLDELPQKGFDISHDTDYAGRLRAFQALSGVEVHGKASPMTLMQLNQVSGVDEPRLAVAP